MLNGQMSFSKLFGAILSMMVLLPSILSIPGCIARLTPDDTAAVTTSGTDTTDSKPGSTTAHTTGKETESTTAHTTDKETESTTAPTPTPVKVKEVRGVWIASVYNINYPSRSGLSAAQLRTELDDIVNTAAATGLNAIYFQVRPSGDALYKSNLFPTSAYLTGTQGAPLPDGFDPLAYLVEKAHAKGIAVHAWVNPMRVTVGSATSPSTDVTKLAASNPARKNPGWVVAYADGRLYYDPGIPEVRKLIADGCAEIAANYNVDGIIFDDYFYPYPPSATTVFNDTQTFSKYGAAYQSLGDWRRDNVNKMVQACYRAIKDTNPDCQFGIAPFGIWQNDDGKNGGSATRGLSSYSAIFCDSLAWIKGGYIDYIAPQIYWQFSYEVARYDVLAQWWNEQVAGTGVDLLICHGVYRYDEWQNPEGEMTSQIAFARNLANYRGSIHYGYAAIKANSHGLADELKAAYKTVVYYDSKKS